MQAKRDVISVGRKRWAAFDSRQADERHHFERGQRRLNVCAGKSPNLKSSDYDQQRCSQRRKNLDTRCSTCRQMSEICGARARAVPIIYRSDKAVATTRQGLDKSWMFGVVSQRGPNFRNRGIQRLVKIDERIFGPDLLAKLFSRNQFARVGQKDGAHLKRLPLQWHPRSIPVQLSGPQVRLKGPEPNDSSRTLHLHRTTCLLVETLAP
jgi:hypothetical protein